MNRRRNPLEQLHLRQQLLTREAVIFIGLLKGLCFASLYTTVLSPVGFHYLTFLAYHLTASQSICPPVLLSVKLILCIHLCSHLLTFNVFFFFFFFFNYHRLKIQILFKMTLWMARRKWREIYIRFFKAEGLGVGQELN